MGDSEKDGEYDQVERRTARRAETDPRTWFATNDDQVAIEEVWAVANVVKNPVGDVCGSPNLSAATYFRDAAVHRSTVETLKERIDSFEKRIEAQFGETYGCVARPRRIVGAPAEPLALRTVRS